jgi:hypothetical protein
MLNRILLIFMLTACAWAQGTKDDICSVVTAGASAPWYTGTHRALRFRDDPTAQQIVDKILSHSGLNPGNGNPQNFEAIATNHSSVEQNAQAKICGDGQRYIFYDPSWLQGLHSTDGPSWTIYFIFAHEIGHHLLNHPLYDKGDHKQLELDADRFAGFTLARMGAPLEDILRAVDAIPSERDSKSHPARDRREKAAREGYEDSLRQLSQIGTPSDQPAPKHSTPSNSAMVGWWPGDGNSNDIIGGNHGTRVGSVTFAPGKVGQAFNFHETSSLVNIPASGNLDLRNAVTLAAWIQPTSFQAPSDEWVLIAGKPDGYQLNILPNGQIRFGFPSGDPHGAVNKWVDSKSSVSTTTFTFVAGSYDSVSGLISIYINGRLEAIAKTSGLIDSVAKPLQIGCFSDPALRKGYGSYTGLIDEIKIFNRALSASEIQDIFNSR